MRTGNIARYLARSGWEVTVLTPDPSVWRYVEEPRATEIGLTHEGIRRLPTRFGWRWLAGGGVKSPGGWFGTLAGKIGRRVLARVGIESTVGWDRAAEQACSSLGKGDVDVILASGPTFSVFPLAQRLAARLECPYVLDYRDLWSQNLHNPARRAARKEALVLAGSMAVTTVSRSWGSLLDREFGVGPKLHVVSNGYDEEQLASVVPHEFDHFAIVYAGVFYPPKRVISPVMAALKQLDRTSRREWRFHYYGKHGLHVRQEAQRFGVAPRVIVHGQVSRSEALAAVKGAGVAVVITSVVEPPALEDNGMVTGKIFEAIGLGTPVLLVAPDGSDANEVAEVAGLARGFPAHDVDRIVSFLDDLMDNNRPALKDPSAYAWRNLVRRFDMVLRGLI